LLLDPVGLLFVEESIVIVQLVFVHGFLGILQEFDLIEDCIAVFNSELGVQIVHFDFSLLNPLYEFQLPRFEIQQFFVVVAFNVQDLVSGLLEVAFALHSGQLVVEVHVGVR